MIHIQDARTNGARKFSAMINTESKLERCETNGRYNVSCMKQGCIHVQVEVIYQLQPLAVHEWVLPWPIFHKLT